MGYFLQQTYSPRQLVIVCDGTPEYNEEIAGLARKHPTIKHVAIPPQEGEETKFMCYLRNASLDHADGDIIVQWDDDDVHHETRIAAQFAELQKEGSDACLIMDYQLKIGDKEPEKVRYLIVDGLPQGHPATIMFKRTAIRYKHVEKHEDTTFLGDLIDSGYSCALLGGQHHLYTYCYRGDNICGYSHFLLLKKWQGKRIGFNVSRKRDASSPA